MSFLKDVGREVRDFLGGTVSWPLDLMGGGLWGGVAPAASGAVVTEYTALQVAAYYACIRIISDQIASLPLLVMERQADGSEIPAWNHPLMNVLHTQPNPEICGADFKQAGQGHLLLNGNCYIQIVSNEGGSPAALYLRSPFRTFPYRNSQTGELIYKTTDTLNDREEKILPEDMIHVKGFSFDGLVGLSPVKVYAREVLGVDLAAQNYSAKFFANDSRPGGYLKSVNTMKDAAKLTAVQTWNAAHSQGSSHRMALLDGGLTWEQVGVAPEEAQFIQTRQFNRSQIAAIFGVPGHMVGDDADAPRAVLEQKGVEFLLYTIKPWARKWEQAINSKLFPTGGKYSAKFDTTELERPTYDVLLKGIQMARYAGLMSGNEGRKLLKLNPRIKSDYESKNPADALWMPVNMVPIKAEEPQPAEPKPPASTSQGGVGGNDQQPGTHSKVFVASFTDAVNRISARKNPTEKDFEKIFLPVLTSIAMSTRTEDIIPAPLASFIGGYIKGIAHRFAEGKFGLPADELTRAVGEIGKKSSELDPEDEDEEKDGEDQDE
jgi:HK97 family phage portal protein